MVQYPYIGRHVKTDIIVLFTAPKTGIRLSGDYLGYSSTKWAEDKFARCPPDFELTLRNAA